MEKAENVNHLKYQAGKKNFDNGDFEIFIGLMNDVETVVIISSASFPVSRLI